MENWTYRLKNPTTRFDVIEVLGVTAKSRRMRIRAENGEERDVWMSKRRTAFYTYTENGATRMEIMVPDWLAVKTGLMEATA